MVRSESARMSPRLLTGQDGEILAGSLSVKLSEPAGMATSTNQKLLFFRHNIHTYRHIQYTMYAGIKPDAAPHHEKFK